MPKTPEMYATGAASLGDKRIAAAAATRGGIKAGREIPTPGTGLASALATIVTIIVAIIVGSNGALGKRYKLRMTGMTAPPIFTAIICSCTRGG